MHRKCLEKYIPHIPSSGKKSRGVPPQTDRALVLSVAGWQPERLSLWEFISPSLYLFYGLKKEGLGMSL